MAIPYMTDDLEIIQALSDLPNSEDGLGAQELKAKFDAAGLAIQSYINERLIPALAAAHIPFKKTNEINAETIQLAMEDVQRQVRDAATGSIVNGSITKEKIAASLLDRIYGGRAWVSADTPGPGHNPDTDFPIGQVWLRPEFTVVNEAGDAWSATGCTAVKRGNDVVLTGLSQVAAVKASQNLAGIGNAGDRVVILFQIKDRDSEITQMTASVNGAAAQQISGSVSMEAVLSSVGTLTLEIGVAWPSTSLAFGSVTLGSYTVVNLDKIMRQMNDAREVASWSEYLWSKTPFTQFVSPELLFIQQKSGVWDTISFDVLPISRGGTGLKATTPDRYMKTNSDGSIGFLSKDDVIADIGVLRLMTGTYTGTGDARSVTLPVAPKLLQIHRVDPHGTIDYRSSTYYFVPDSAPAVLTDGSQVLMSTFGRIDSVDGFYIAGLKLSGNTLSFYVDSNSQLKPGKADHLNASGVTYGWTALY